MLITRPQIKVVEKIFENEEGVFVRGFFAVLEWQGEYRVKLIRTESLNEDTSNAYNTHEFRKEEVCCLEGVIEKIKIEALKDEIHFESPFNLKDLTFFTSQLTRAPAF